MKKLTWDFYQQDVLVVAPQLLGKYLVRKLVSGELLRLQILETEAYRGEEDTACHARVGKTRRTAPMYEVGGYSYIYLCYGIHHLFNVVTGNKDQPQAVLIRAVDQYNGPGKLTKAMQIDQSLNAVDLTNSQKIWIEDHDVTLCFKTTKRIGIDYATETYRNIKWRFVAEK